MTSLLSCREKNIQSLKGKTVNKEHFIKQYFFLCVDISKYMLAKCYSGKYIAFLKLGIISKIYNLYIC